MTSQRKRRALLLVGLLIGALILPHAVAALADLFTPTSGDITLQSNDGPTVTLTDTSGVNFDPAFPDDQTVVIQSQQGNITLASSQPTNATITQPTGTWTRLQGLDVSQAAISIDPAQKQRVTIEGGATSLEFRDVTIGDDKTDFTYSSNGQTTLTIPSVTTPNPVLAVDPDTNEVLGSDTDGGSVSLTLDSGTHDAELVLSNGGPGLSNPSPVGTQPDTPNEIAVDVSDPDFPQDDVDVTATLDGTTIGTKQISSDSRVSFSLGDIDRGTHNVTVTATDSYDQTSSTSWSFGVPNTLSIYNASDTSERVEQFATYTFYTDAGIVTKNSSDGTVNLSNVPISGDGPIVVGVETEDYHQRTYVIDDVARQQRLYLLPLNASSVEVRFTLTETPGYPREETVLYVQRALTVNGSTDWQTVVADEFGVEGVTTHLADGERYRLKIKSPDGRLAVLGKYTATVPETVPLQPAAPTIDTTAEDAPISWGARTDNQTLVIGFEDNNGTSSEVTVVVHRRGDESQLLAPNSTYVSVSSIAQTIPMTPTEANQSWVVKYHVTQEEGGETQVYRALVGSGSVGTVPFELGTMWQQVIVAGILIMFAGAFAAHNRGVGALGIAVIGGLLHYLGWMEGITSGPAVTVALGIGVYSLLNRRQ